MATDAWGHSVNEKSHLVLGGCGVPELAELYGTPLHVVDTTRLCDSYRRFLAAFRAHYLRDCVAEAITDPETRRQAIQQLKANLTGRRTVVPALEFAARVNREIGLGSDQQAGVRIVFKTNVRPERLRRARR
jgi:hypothetical protein